MVGAEDVVVDKPNVYDSLRCVFFSCQETGLSTLGGDVIMTSTKRIVLTSFVVSVLVGALGYTLVPIAHAQSKVFEIAAPKFVEDGIRVSNAKIDCSINEAFHRGVYSHYALAAGFTDCRSCHRSANPVAGRGDRPSLRFGTAGLQNKADKPIDVRIKAGENGEWVNYDIAPGKTMNISWEYQKAGENRSPKYFVMVDGTKHELKLLATPNQQLGNLYFIQKGSNDDKLHLWLPHQKPHRRR